MSIFRSATFVIANVSSSFHLPTRAYATKKTKELAAPARDSESPRERNELSRPYTHGIKEHDAALPIRFYEMAGKREGTNKAEELLNY